MRPPRRGEVWTVETPEDPQEVLVISSTVYNEIGSEPTVLVALVLEEAIEEGFCVNLGDGQWAVMGLVTFVPKDRLIKYLRRVDADSLAEANDMLLRILTTPE